MAEQSLSSQSASIVICGRHPVSEALTLGLPIHAMYVDEALCNRGDIADLVTLGQRRGVQIRHVSRSTLDKITDRQHHQGVALRIRPPRGIDLQDLLSRLRYTNEPPLLIIADHLLDPRNLGAIIRSAVAAGAHGLIVPRDRAVPLTTSVYRSSSGAAIFLPIATVVNLSRAIRTVQTAGIWTVGLDPIASQNIYDIDLTSGVCLITGGEGTGLSRLVREHCDHIARIPMGGPIQSLNSGVATAIALFEARRQRQYQHMKDQRPSLDG